MPPPKEKFKQPARRPSQHLLPLQNYEPQNQISGLALRLLIDLLAWDPAACLPATSVPQSPVTLRLHAESGENIQDRRRSPQVYLRIRHQAVLKPTVVAPCLPVFQNTLRHHGSPQPPLTKPNLKLAHLAHP
jgi:hypothetical protein